MGKPAATIRATDFGKSRTNSPVRKKVPLAPPLSSAARMAGSGDGS